MEVPDLILRLQKGAPLTAEEGDRNLEILRDFINGLAKLFEVVFNPDGTLKTGVIGTNSITDRSVTQTKLDWLHLFYGTAAGTDNYTLELDPPDDFELGDGATTAFWAVVKFTNGNTGPVTIDVNGIGAKDLKKLGGNALVDGDILDGSIHILVYDGTNFQLVTSLAPGANAHGTVVIDTPGAGTWTVPSGVYTIEVEVVGAGGGGGAYAAPWGGGGGGYSYKRWSVTPGDIINYTVGGKGTASTGSSDSTDGEDTVFNATQIAGGGKNGDAGKGAGGTATGGDVNIPGGNGFPSGGSLSASDKRTGGNSGRSMGFGGFLNGSAGADVAPTGYGGGGYGDDDSGGGPDTSDGSDGVLIIHW